MAIDAKRKKTRKPRQEPEIMPLAYAGKWIAWSADGMKILAVGESTAEVERLAHQAGEPNPIFEVGPYPHPL